MSVTKTKVRRYSLGSPGMPSAGPNFRDYAESLGDNTEVVVKTIVGDNGRKKKVTEIVAGDTLRSLYSKALRQPGFTLPLQMKPGVVKTVSLVPGHIWGQHATDYANRGKAMVDGPHRADVMVIGKMPGVTETKDRRNLVGEAGQIFLETLRELHVPDVHKWYVTNLIKFQPPDGNTSIKAAWLQDCLPLLQLELRIVRPKYILCLGADASKTLLGSKFNVGYMDGRVMDYTFDVRESHEDPEEFHTAKVMAVISPSQVVRAPEQKRVMARGLSRFNLLQSGKKIDEVETDIDHRVIKTLKQLEALLWEIEHDPVESEIVAVDAEWHGEHPINKGAYLRTVQFSWREKKAASIVLTAPGGKVTFVDSKGKPAIKQAMAMLTKFLADKRVGGHFFVADLEWLVHYGLDIRKQYYVPLYDSRVRDMTPRVQKKWLADGYKRDDVVPAWLRTKYEGGWDTGLRGHAIEETAQLGLEMLAMRYTPVPRYDIPLQEWKLAHCKKEGLKAKDMEGYGFCPEEILTAYGNYDADATLRLFFAQEPLIDCDYEGNCCREPAWESMITTLPILEMHRNGIPADKKRIDDLTIAFMEAKAATEAKIRKWAKWPDFNIRSTQQVKEFLFGHRYNGKVTKSGEIVRIRPPEGRTLGLKPLLDTSKPPKQWADIVEQGKEREHSPGTNKTVLGILSRENLEQADQVNWVRDYRFLDQVLKSVLRPPVTDEDDRNVFISGGGDDGDAYATDNLAGYLYDAGLASVICSDGRIRTHLYPTTETGRWRSARPNLQNISKRRDPDYVRLLGGHKNEKGKWVGGKYTNKLRSIFYAPPGKVLIEADYIGAELYSMAIMSGDPAMIDHATRNQLPEDHPNHYDIHSHVAVVAFNLDCAPNKKALEAAGLSPYRIHAKNVIFGIAYGRGAKAIALQAREEGNPISPQEAQQIIDAIFALYPGLVPFFNECKRRAIEERWLCSCFGRLRRFPYSGDRSLNAEFQRQSMNFGIQSMVASAVDRAAAYAMDYRDNVVQDPGMFDILLQIHDALLFAVPYANVEFVVDEVLPYCMSTLVPIYPTELDGTPTGTGPFRLGIDVAVEHHWGEKVTYDQAVKWGIPPVTAKGHVIAEAPKIKAA